MKGQGPGPLSKLAGPQHAGAAAQGVEGPPDFFVVAPEDPPFGLLKQFRCALQEETHHPFHQLGSPRLLQPFQGPRVQARRHGDGFLSRDDEDFPAMARRVLVIDDMEDVREIARAGLERAGWEVEVAASGPQGLELAARRVPDAVLLDVKMPGMDGRAVAEALRRRAATRSVPVVLLTAGPGEASGVEAAGVIPKPFDPLTLAERLAGLLGWD